MTSFLTDYANGGGALRVTVTYDTLASCDLHWGLTANLELPTESQSNYSERHEYDLGALPDTIYYLQAHGRSPAGAVAIGWLDSVSTYPFDTWTADVGSNRATVGWNTDSLCESTSSVIFGKQRDLSDGSSVSQTELVTKHRVELTKLDASTWYYFEALSVCADGDTLGSRLDSFVTLRWGSSMGESVIPETYAYPNPFVIGQTDYVTFSGIPAGHMLVIVTASGTQIVKEIPNDSGGEIYWDGRNASGSIVANGVYLWYVKDTDRSGKLIVER
jgi:hypothetical protein